MSFGKWYDDQKQQQQQPPPPAAAPSNSMSLSSLFSPSTSAEEGDIESQSLLESFSLSSMRSSLEAQLPQKIMGMNYQQRFQIFCISLLLSALFFALGFFVGLPLLTVRPQKFALSFTCGSITFMSSFAILKGPQAHFASMMTGDRIHFTVFYLGSMVLTLYLTFTAGGAKGYILVLGASAMQLLALLWYLVTFLPGGAMGMKVLTQALWTLLRPLMIGCAKFQAMCIGRCVSWYASRFTSSES
ncbi:hypothetical protein HJC23_007838 [Cyclotella cryptica]|uniref:Vesicle transport protein n=1 Tax=Cyclotella cryptica TaxID=29204 RepID=A0ABD3R023_9STRA